MQNSMNFLARIFLYQIPLYNSFIKFRKILISQQEFTKKLNTLLNDLKLTTNENLIHFPENDDIIFRFILLTVIIISILSILNIKTMQFLSGIISIIFAFIYYNPFYKINQLSDKNTFIKIINHIFVFPSIQFLLLITTGFAMISISYKNLVENKESSGEKRAKINDKIEYDIESISSSYNGEKPQKKNI